MVRDVVHDLQERFPALKELESRTSGSALAVFNVEVVKGSTVWANGADANGSYNPGTYEIRIGSGLQKGEASLTPGKWVVGSDKNMASTLRHELGHSTQKFFEGKVRDNAGFDLVDTSKPWGWTVRDIYKEAKDTAARTLSRYAATDHAEFFAESFSAYTHPDYGKGSLRIHPTLEKLFDKVYKGQ